MIKTTLFLTLLLVCHYMADFCFTFPVMIKAKADGKNLWPILLHSFIHAILIGLCLLLFGINWHLMFLLALLELVSHFLIDKAKARLSVCYQYLADMRYKPNWMLYGFDQLLHQFVVFLIWYCCITNYSNYP